VDVILITGRRKRHMHTYHKQQSSLWLAMKEKKRQNIVNGFGLMMVEKLRGHCYYVSLYVRRVMFVGMYALESAVMRWIMEVRKGLIALQMDEVVVWQEQVVKWKVCSDMCSQPTFQTDKTNWTALEKRRLGSNRPLVLFGFEPVFSIITILTYVHFLTN